MFLLIKPLPLFHLSHPHPVSPRMIPEKEGDTKGEGFCSADEEKAGGDRVLRAGRGLLEHVVITASLFQEGEVVGARNQALRGFTSSVPCP